MRKIGLISCVKSKKEIGCKAKDMYISPWFRKGYEYLSYRCDVIYIMSAKYGLLSSDTFILPYNESLLKMNKRKRMIWSYKMIKSLERKTDLKNDYFIILGGKKYIEYICQKIPNFELPFEKIPTPPPHGNIVQMHWLNVWNNELKIKYER